jgi:hypothetical protein
MITKFVRLYFIIMVGISTFWEAGGMALVLGGAVAVYVALPVLVISAVLFVIGGVKNATGNW